MTRKYLNLPPDKNCTEAKSLLLTTLTATPLPDKIILRDMMNLYDYSTSYMPTAIKNIIHNIGVVIMSLECDSAEQTYLDREDHMFLQEYIQWLAEPRVGRDRLAIALAHMRDYFKSPAISVRVEELRGASSQLQQLNDYLFED